MIQLPQSGPQETMVGILPMGINHGWIHVDALPLRTIYLRRLSKLSGILSVGRFLEHVLSSWEL